MNAIDDIKALISKAAKANESADAMRFAQAAQNAAQAACIVPALVLDTGVEKKSSAA